MKYSVDRIIDNIIVLENLKTSKIREIDRNILNFDVSEGDILVYKRKKYIKDDKIKEDRTKIIMEKFFKVFEDEESQQ